jgi:hypothetical protein
MTPSFCFNERALRDFLRLSRSAIDDTISTSLNALLTPSSTSPFTATTTSRISSPRPPSRTPLPSASCRAFTHSVLFPTWQTRSDSLTYCASVATSPDPDDPTLLSREIESQRERERVVDERLDPYSARSAAGLYRRTARTEALAQLLRNERAVENIIRERSWSVIQDRCAGGMEGRWEDALDKWREEEADGRAKEGR